MPRIDPLVLVVGATGSIGRHVLDGLVARGIPVRASSRAPRPGAFPAGVEAVAADLTDPGSLERAMTGASSAFLPASPEGVHGVIAAARRAGLQRVVLLSSGSVIHPSSAGNAITEEHRVVEEAFAAATDLRVVPIRPLVLASNALGWARAIRSGSPVPLYRPEAVTAPVHERDVADIAVAALLGADPAEAGRMLTGPERLSQRDQVAMVAAAAGREVAVEEEPREALLSRLQRFMPPAEAEAVARFLDDAAAGNSPATTAVERILGRPATGFAVWASDHAADFA